MGDPSNSSNEGGARYYTWPATNERFPSVTTILSVIDKSALKYWAAKGVAEYAVDNVNTWTQLDRPAAVDLLKRAPFRYTEKRIDLGTAVHEACEAYMKGEATTEWPPDIQKYMENFVNFLQEWKPTFQASEITVYSRQHKYAGTFDLLMWFGNELVLLDIKTGANGPWPEAALQLTAYARPELLAGGPDETATAPTDRALGWSRRPWGYPPSPAWTARPSHR